MTGRETLKREVTFAAVPNTLKEQLQELWDSLVRTESEPGGISTVTGVSYSRVMLTGSADLLLTLSAHAVNELSELYVNREKDVLDHGSRAIAARDYPQMLQQERDRTNLLEGTVQELQEKARALEDVVEARTARVRELEEARTKDAIDLAGSRAQNSLIQGELETLSAKLFTAENTLITRDRQLSECEAESAKRLGSYQVLSAEAADLRMEVTDLKLTTDRLRQTVSAGRTQPLPTTLPDSLIAALKSLGTQHLTDALLLDTLARRDARIVELEEVNAELCATIDKQREKVQQVERENLALSMGGKMNEFASVPPPLLAPPYGSSFTTYPMIATEKEFDAIVAFLGHSFGPTIPSERRHDRDQIRDILRHRREKFGNGLYTVSLPGAYLAQIAGAMGILSVWAGTETAHREMEHAREKTDLKQKVRELESWIKNTTAQTDYILRKDHQKEIDTLIQQHSADLTKVKTAVHHTGRSELERQLKAAKKRTNMVWYAFTGQTLDLSSVPMRGIKWMVYAHRGYGPEEE